MKLDDVLTSFMIKQYIYIIFNGIDMPESKYILFNFCFMGPMHAGIVSRGSLIYNNSPSPPGLGVPTGAIILQCWPTFQPALGNTPWQSDSHGGWLILPELNCSSPIASSSSIHSAITHLQASPWGARGIISHSSTWKISAQPRKQRGRKASQIQFKLAPSNEWHKKEQQRC